MESHPKSPISIETETWINNVRKLARTTASSSSADETINALITGETVDPRYARVASDVSAIIREQFPTIPGLAVILLGSGMHGGARMRELTGGANDNSDFDWGILTDSGITEDLAYSMVDKVKSKIGQIGITHGISSLTSCRTVNPANGHRQTNYTSLNEAVISLEAEINPYKEGHKMISDFLVPSFPPEVNERNFSFLKKALEQQYESDPEVWEQMIYKT